MTTTDRRRFLTGSLSGAATLMLLRNALANGSLAESRKAKRCLVLWMNGGPSQLETFDPKTGSNGGPTGAIQTKIPGVKFSANLPKLAERADRLAVLRNITSPEGEHERAQYYLHTGFRLVPAFPRPALGSVISHESPASDIPSYVLLGRQTFGPAYCGPDHAAFAIANADDARRLMSRTQRRRSDLEFLQQLNQPFDEQNAFPAVKRRRSMIDRIARLVETPFRRTLDVERESASTRARYGEGEFGQRCLIARRLLERDVPFVEVQLDGWDTHVNNFDAVSQLARPLDSAFAALLDDLQSSGLLEDTLIVWTGEFGRTPLINAQSGRDHFPRVTPVVLAGGALPTGQVVGKTSSSGAQIRGDSHSIPDLCATLFQLLGVDREKEFRTSFDSPTKPVEEGARLIPAIAPNRSAG